MFNNDFILRMTEGIGNMSASVLGLKDTRKEEVVQLEGLSDSNIFKTIITKHLKTGKFNEAEDFLFTILENDPSDELFEIAFWMYAELEKKSDEELLASNFSREEIAQGLDDINKRLM
jgi:hypothetical protein